MGGIFMNIILGILIFWGHIYTYGKTYIPASETQAGIVAYPLANDIGLETGDKIVEVNGKPVTRWDEVRNVGLILDQGNTYTIERNGQRQTIELPSDMGRRVLERGIDSFISLRTKFFVGAVTDNTPAQKVGLKEGDRILTVNDEDVTYFNDFQNILAQNKGKEVSVVVKREDTIAHTAEQLTFVPTLTEEGTLGFKVTPDVHLATEKFGFFESLPLGINEAWERLAETVKTLWRVVTNDIPASKSVSSFIGIANAYGGQWQWNKFWRLTGILSMVLAFMNFLPIPALDGGHVFVFADRSHTRASGIATGDGACTDGGDGAYLFAHGLCIVQ